MHKIYSCISFFLLFFSLQYTIYAQTFKYQWGTQVGGMNAQGGTAVCFDNKGNTLVGGVWQDEIDFNPPAQLDTADSKGYFNNIYVVKYNPVGQQQWRFVLRSTGPYDLALNDIETDAQGNIIIGGNYASSFDLDPDPSNTVMATMAGIGCSFIAKYDKDGKYLWSITLKSMGAFSTSVKDLEAGPQGDIYVTGNFQQVVDFDPDSAATKTLYGASNSIFIARYSAAGKYLDVHFFYCADANYSYPTAMKVDKGGNVFVTGNLYSNTFAVNGFYYPNGPQLMGKGFGDIFLIKLNADLYPVWWHAMNTTEKEIPTALGIDDSSNVFITGFYNLPLDMDPSANTWTLNYSYQYQTNQLFLAKYDSSGTIKWARSFDGKGSQGMGIDVDMKRNIYLSITAADTAWLNPGVDKAYVFNGTGGKGFVKMDPNGKALFGDLYGGQNMVQTQACMDVDPLGNLAFTNNFFSQLDLDFSSGTAIKNSVNYSDGFAAVYSTCVPSGTTAKPSIIANGDSLCAGDSMRLRIVNKGYDLVAWSTGATDTFITIYSPGVYKVAAIKGCDIPSGDSIIIRLGQCNKVGISSFIVNNQLQLYPNPTSLQVHLKMVTQENIERIVIYDMKGCMVSTVFILDPSSDYLLDIASLNNGTYVLQVITAGNVYHQRMVVER